MPLDLSKLHDGQRVRYRLSKRDNKEGTAPEYDPWTEGTLYLVRREKPLPKRIKRTRKSQEVGSIITLAIRDIGWADYSEDDYDPEYNEWLAEEYRMQIEPIL